MDSLVALVRPFLDSRTWCTVCATVVMAVSSLLAPSIHMYTSLMLKTSLSCGTCVATRGLLVYWTVCCARVFVTVSVIVSAVFMIMIVIISDVFCDSDCDCNFFFADVIVIVIVSTVFVSALIVIISYVL